MLKFLVVQYFVSQTTSNQEQRLSLQLSLLWAESEWLLYLLCLIISHIFCLYYYFVILINITIMLYYLGWFQIFSISEKSPLGKCSQLTFLCTIGYDNI